MSNETKTESDVQKAALALVLKIREIHADPLYQAVWIVANQRGINYDHGPKYDKELGALEDALNLK